MAERRHTRGLATREEAGTLIISIRNGIWRGKQLSLLRDTLIQIVGRQMRRVVGVDLKGVHDLPSGFFGTLCEWHDRGVVVRIYSPEPRIREMYWFQQFFAVETADCFRLCHPRPSPTVTPSRQLYDASGADGLDGIGANFGEAT
jgi:hypothetical protein